jgi:hypothetical protein
VATVSLPLGGLTAWVNQELVTTPYDSHLTPPDYDTDFPHEVDTGGADMDFYGGIIQPRPEGEGPYTSVPYGAFAVAMYRGRPNENDLAVLQWRYGR